MSPHSRFPDGLDGNFTTYIPRLLTTLDLHLAAAPPEAVGFPRTVTYAASRAGLTTAGQRLFVAEYRPRFETFIHAGSCRKLTYTWAAGGPFHVDVLHNREPGEWNIYKFRAGRLVSHASGQGYGETMIRASGIGLDASEPAFTFAGDPEECRRENVAQAGFAREGETEPAGEMEAGDEFRSPTLVFGAVPSALGGSNLVFVPLEKARELAAIANAMTAKTWGEFKLNVPANRLPELLAKFLECGAWSSFDSFYQAYTQSGTRAEREALWQRYEELAPGERLPLDEDTFHPEAISGAAGGNWPERPEQGMLRWLPPPICGPLGCRVHSCLRGDYLFFNPGHAPEILTALEAAGYSCYWDEDLVRRACGRRSKIMF
jgi:hypothetical protein